jgi:hypothetical protein
MANPRGNPATLKPGQRRKKGSKNKFTNLKDAFLKAFEEVGGKDALIKFYENPKNRAAFFQMISKMLPSKQEVDLKGKDVKATESREEMDKWLRECKIKK